MLPDIWVQIDVCWILLQGQQRTPVHQYVRYCHKVTTLCSVYQARSFEPSRALQAPFSTELIYVSMLFILDIASTMQKPRKWSELRLIWLCWIYWTQCYYFCASIDFNISDLEEWGVHFVQRGSIWLTFCIHKDYTMSPNAEWNPYAKPPSEILEWFITQGMFCIFSMMFNIFGQGDWKKLKKESLLFACRRTDYFCGFTTTSIRHDLYIWYQPICEHLPQIVFWWIYSQYLPPLYYSLNAPNLE